MNELDKLYSEYGKIVMQIEAFEMRAKQLKEAIAKKHAENSGLGVTEKIQPKKDSK